MKKILLLSITSFSLISCEGLSVTLGPEGFTGSYTKEIKGGKIIIPITIQPEK